MTPAARDQPDGARRNREGRAENTIRLVEQALAQLTEQQKHLPPKDRRFPTSAIQAEVAKLRPEYPPLHRSTLSRNPEVRRLVAEARGQELLAPNFQWCGGWTALRVTSPRHRSRRRQTLLQWSVSELAEYVVGLEELERHCVERRQQIEAVDWPSGPWPANHPYPLTPLRPSGGALERYEQYRQRTRRELVRAALRVERDVAEHQAHLLRFDERHHQHRPAAANR